jgi:O-antigen ligase
MIQNLRRNLPEIALFTLLLAAFVLGGSARADTASLVLMRPTSIMLLALALVMLPRATLEGNRTLLLAGAAWAILAVAHLLPLPPAVWQAIAGRELASEIDAAVGISVWRPVSLVPWRTLNALFALAVPLGVVLLALATSFDKMPRIVYMLFGLVLVSALMGLFQLLGGSGNAFYLYRITNAESAVGLFANRNHNAIFLAMGLPLLAATLALLPVSAEHVKLREWAGYGIGLLLIPFILTTQSRAGILVAIVCAGLALWVYRSPAETAQKRRPRRQIDPRMAFAVFAAAGLAALTFVFTATNALERLGRLGREDNELRLQIWPPIAQLAADYLPFGSGLGTFVEVYQVVEPDSLLSPRYINHAHNDWLELLLTGGLPAVALAVLGAVVIYRNFRRNRRESTGLRDGVLRRLGASICVVIALASLYDYPIRTPAGAALLAFGVVLTAGRWRSPVAPT